MTEKIKVEMSENMIFSLDIGTRNVVGTIGYKKDDHYRILDFEIIAHPDRAMYDGQIHDIDKVANVVKKVKENLEKRTGLELNKVAIAAAGRALKTNRVTIEREIDNTKIIAKDIIDNIEMEGIQIAQNQLSEKNGKRETGYYCVGYSIVKYYLDGSIIMNPKGHRGNQLQVDLIATFLPHVVVDSLYTVVDKVGLEVINLTLEPIAAINIAIPDKFRLLNLALVDVGAGTSDIAITKDGSIVSYAMVDVAGDEITEALSTEFLLDFDTAEKLKVNLNIMDNHEFSDIVGISHEYSTNEILKRIEPAIKSVTTQIGERILEYNEKAPSAIFCIGGGCQIPGFTNMLSESVDLKAERTVIKGTEMLDNVHFDTEKLIGPEYITPVGIGFTALKDKEQDFLQVVVNEKKIRLFNSKELSVSDALVLIGYSARKLISKRGESLVYKVNGKEKTAMGEYGEPAKIYVNGRIANLDTKIQNRDIITIDPATPGESPEKLVKDIINFDKVIYYNNEAIKMFREYRVNDKCIDENYVIKNGDSIEIKEMLIVSDFIEWFEISLDGFEIFVNGIKAIRSQSLEHSDIVEVRKVELLNNFIEEVVTLSNFNEKTEQNKEPLEEVRMELFELEEKYIEKDYLEDDFLDDGYCEDNCLEEGEVEEVVKASNTKEEIKKETIKTTYTFTVNNKTEIVTTEKDKLVVVDIFDFIDFDLSVAKGIIVIEHNGKKANYTDILKNQDILEIYWK